MTTPKKASKDNIIKNAIVRYYTETKMWGVVENTDTMKATRYFSYGVMKNVKFSTYPVTEERRSGCGYAYEKVNVGVAVGTLYIGEEAKSMLKAQNLKFGNDGFLNYKNNPIKRAKQLAMTPDRRALYWS